MRAGRTFFLVLVEIFLTIGIKGFDAKFKCIIGSDSVWIQSVWEELTLQWSPLGKNIFYKNHFCIGKCDPNLKHIITRWRIFVLSKIHDCYWEVMTEVERVGLFRNTERKVRAQTGRLSFGFCTITHSGPEPIQTPSELSMLNYRYLKTPKSQRTNILTK